MTTSTILLQVSAVGWGVLCGGIVYEHLAVVPQWSARPPESLTMWTGPHRVKAERFWIGIHPILIGLLAAAMITGWSDVARRTSLMVVLGTYLAALALTGVWFVPELLRLTTDPAAPIPPAEWGDRAKRWEKASIVRGVILVGMAWPLLDALRAA
ncbi:MAG: hypothetical protein U0325_00735 [Polyangiales bacterium]